MDKLGASEKKMLKQISHDMNPVVMIGKNGLTESVIKALNTELDNHEVIKVKFQKFKDDRKEIAEELAEISHSTIIKLLGNIVTLYRESSDPEKRVLGKKKKT